MARARDFGVNDDRFFVRSHLGPLLKAGDTVMGYDLENSNLNIDFDLDDLPDIVLVHKKRPPWRWRTTGTGRRAKKGGGEEDEEEETTEVPGDTDAVEHMEVPT